MENTNQKKEYEQKAKEKEARRQLYTVEEHEIEHARGGEEDGTDGWWKATVTDKDGNATLVIVRNIFDFGYYGYPSRVAGSGNNAALSRDTWTQIEKDAIDWALEFAPISHHLRM
jgi:hypothetical protein